jgi:hypothetical protein
LFYQIVSFTFPTDLEDDVRSDFEASLLDLPANIKSLHDVRVIRALDDPTVTGYISVFQTENDYEEYLTHPAHAPVGERAGALCSKIQRLLLDDDNTPLIGASR